MRLTNTFSGRPAYYDRNPTNIKQEYFTLVGPSGSTQRWTYTVPSGRKAQETFCQMNISRASAATTAGSVQCFIQHTDGSTANDVGGQFNGNVVDNRDASAFGLGRLMSAGETMKANTSDGSTGGSVAYSIGFGATEFDA